MIAHTILQAIDRTGEIVSEAAFDPVHLSDTQGQIDAFVARLTRSGTPFVRVVVDMAVSRTEPPETPAIMPLWPIGGASERQQKIGQLAHLIGTRGNF